MDRLDPLGQTAGDQQVAHQGRRPREADRLGPSAHRLQVKRDGAARHQGPGHRMAAQTARTVEALALRDPQTFQQQGHPVAAYGET